VALDICIIFRCVSAKVFMMSQALPPDFSGLGMDPTAMYYPGMHGNNGLPGGYASSQVRIVMYRFFVKY
jgi:hypothetical protein